MMLFMFLKVSPWYLLQTSKLTLVELQKAFCLEDIFILVKIVL